MARRKTGLALSRKGASACSTSEDLSAYPREELMGLLDRLPRPNELLIAHGVPPTTSDEVTRLRHQIIVQELFSNL